MSDSRAMELDFLGIQSRSNTSGNPFPFDSFQQPSTPAPHPPTTVASPQPSPRNNNLPLTIIFDGSVSVYDVPPEKAMNIIRMAALFNDKTPQTQSASTSPTATADVDRNVALSEELPIAMRRSLHRFFEKRKGR